MSCRSHNTPEWMEMLATELGSVSERLDEHEFFVVNFGSIVKVPTSSGEAVQS